MAFSSTITDHTVGGKLQIRWGTYNSASVATGELDVGMDTVEFLFLQPNTSAVIATYNSVDETVPYAVPASGASKITIDTATDEDGQWIAIGTK